jgi:hypothetical protein
MESKTDEFDAVGVLVAPKVSEHMPVFHPLGHNAELVIHLDSHDRHDIVVFDLFGNQHLLTESLKVA